MTAFIGLNTATTKEELDAIIEANDIAWQLASLDLDDEYSADWE